MITKLRNKNLFYERKTKIDKIHLSNLVNPKRTNLKPQKNFEVDEKIQIVVEGQSNVWLIKELCQSHEISIETYNEWTKDFLNGSLSSGSSESVDVKRSDDDKFRIVIEGKSGELSIAEICRREKIEHDTFLNWCEEFVLIRNRGSIIKKLNHPLYRKNRQIIIDEAGLEVVKFLENYIDIGSPGTTISTKSDENGLEKNEGRDNIVSLQKINDFRYINKYLESVNSKLDNGGVFIGCLETFSARKERLKINNIPVLNDIYYSFEFLINRILPKVSFTKKYYFDITKGSDRLLSKAEGLGRLVSCGFKIMDYKSFDGLLYFVVKKIREPFFDENPSYGPLYKMPRLGKNGEIIGVYKFRTMHPFSEYLQDYMVNAYGYAKSGKPANDFRIPKWGKFMRKFWLDELPQLYNVLRGEIKLVGIRPVSERYFQDIPKEMQKLRMTQKPGCIPPYVALNREGNVLSVLQAEKDYLEEKIRNPYTTDIKYFFKAIYNIVLKNKRSA